VFARLDRLLVCGRIQPALLLKSLCVRFLKLFLKDFMSDFSTASLESSKTVRKAPARILQMRRAVSGTQQSPAPSSSPVTQERLQAVDDLLAQEMSIISTRRKLLLEIEADLAAGGEIEPGDLIYHRELKLVSRKRLNPAVLRPIRVQKQ